MVVLAARWVPAKSYVRLGITHKLVTLHNLVRHVAAGSQAAVSVGSVQGFGSNHEPASIMSSVRREATSAPTAQDDDNSDSAIFSQTTVAIWVLTTASGAFLAVRLWCRHRFSKLWWDDCVLSLSWAILLVAAALMSRTITTGYATDDDKRHFYLFQNTATSMTTLATAWTKVAFAATLCRIVRNHYLLAFLAFVIVTANLVLALGMLSIWIPACEDPRAFLRPEHHLCFKLRDLQYLGGTTIVYGGVIDVLLALFPWFIIRKLLLETREKIGLSLAMSLGAITGIIVIFRAFFQFRAIDNNYHFMVFMSIFNFLEPGVTIIAQTIPMFRVLVVTVKRGSSTPPKWPVGQTVKTTSGPVEGHAASVAKEVSEYLGIHYALPPVGDLRFQPPVRYNGSRKIVAKDFGPACFPSNISAYDADFPRELIDSYGITEVGRKILATITNPGIPVSEDCLTLNVWTKPQVGEKRKAVMVYLHGSSAVPAYNGQFFADQEDVVLVTINYRITFFGFPGNPHGHQNLGLLDQRMAVEWVRDNIAAFGGDPSRITLFGESAGGASVDHYSFAWAHDPIVSGLISMSGTAEGITPLPPAFASELWYNTTSALGCGNASTPDQAAVLACMQSVPAESIVATLINSIDSPTPMPYSPSIDGVLVFTDPSQRPAASVPMLIGNTDNEAGLFRVFVPPQPDLTPEEEDAFWQGKNQQDFVCPAARRAARSASAGDDNNPTWRYRWHGVFPNTELARTPPSGAYHDSEVAVLFGNVDQSLIANTPEEDAVGRYMRGAWAAFAKDPVRGLERYPLKAANNTGDNGKGKGKGGGEGWPKYVAGEQTLVRLGWEGKAGASLVRGDFYDEDC
ncbi:hypothetical protein VTH82DRAFT_1669 [Thermothelomyces myriococcoides]